MTRAISSSAAALDRAGQLRARYFTTGFGSVGHDLNCGSSAAALADYSGLVDRFVNRGAVRSGKTMSDRDGDTRIAQETTGGPGVLPRHSRAARNRPMTATASRPLRSSSSSVRVDASLRETVRAGCSRLRRAIAIGAKTDAALSKCPDGLAW
jgi:hypothetical protein